MWEKVVASEAFNKHGPRMTKLAEIQEAIQQLPPQQRTELIRWLTDEEPPEMLAAIDEADRSFATEGGIEPAEMRRNMKSWLTG